MASPFSVLADALSGKAAGGGKPNETHVSGPSNTKTTKITSRDRELLAQRRAEDIRDRGLPVNADTHIGNRGPVNTHGDIDANLAEQMNVAGSLRPSQ